MKRDLQSSSGFQEFKWTRNMLGIFLCLFFSWNTNSQISLTATGGTPTGLFVNVSDAFLAINAGTHTGSIVISVDGNTTEPLAPTILLASGQGAAVYTDILIKPTVVATIAGATNAGSAVINLDGADNVTIDGSIAVGGTTRDLTIQNTSAITQANVACVRLIGRTTLGLGATNNVIKNCIIIGNTPGNDGSSGSTVATSYGIYAGSTTAGTMANGTGSADHDNLIIQNNEIKKAYIGVHVVGLVAPNQADNVQIIGNDISSSVNGDRVGFKGIIVQQINNGLISQNNVFNIKSIASTSVAGIEVGGTASNNVEISRNKIYEIHSTNAGGWGAYGINITNGTNTLITNNVIHGVLASNYNVVSTTFQAFGIRMTGGTGHRVYYNSVNMYGDITTGPGPFTISAALVVTATGVTGLDIRNNIFNNANTSAIATNAEFVAMWFPNAYNFLNATLNNNAYTVTNSPRHFVGKTGTTMGAGTYSTLTNWQAISQVNNPSNDVNSQLSSGNNNAPFTSNTDLTIPAATSTPLESGGVAIAALGLPNIDHNGVNRPAGTGSAPDMGAYEFEGTAAGDFIAPSISSVTATPATGQCTNTSHVVDAVITDAVGVTSATLSYSFNGVPQTPISMSLSAGTALNGTWSGTIPAATGSAVLVSFSVQASDAAGNMSAVTNGTSYTDEYLTVTTTPASQTITLGSSVTLLASTNDPAKNGVLITEIIQFKTGTGAGTYASYVPAPDNDFIELTNLTSSPANVAGYQVQLVGGVTGTYVIPAGVIIPANSTMVLAFAATTNSPADNYYGMGIPTTSSGVGVGYILRNSGGIVLDAVATNGYVFAGGTGVTAAHWSGAIPSSSGLAGVRRTVANDNNLASDWTLSSAGNLTDIGVLNAGLNPIVITTFFTWSPGGQTTDEITETPGTDGTFLYTATYNDGTCTAQSTSTITVIVPVTPVADFSATPLTGNAPTVVNFTDLSTNLPNAWSWTLSPSTGFTYTSGTSATSQNPQITFTGPGIYTVTLVASNGAGSDDSTKVDYIVINTCTSTASFTADTDIGNVTFGTLNNGVGTPTLSNPAANALYTDFTGLTPETYTQGLSYPLSITQITSGGTFYAAYVNVFIDYNQDGIYDPITEKVFSTGMTSGTVPTLSGNVTIPLSALTGVTGMRVILDEDANSGSLPCGNYNYGETEDYLIEILPCLITAPTLVVSSNNICIGQSLTMDATTSGAISYDWLKDGLSTGVTTPVFTISSAVVGDAGVYECVVTGCDVVNSNTTTIVISSPTSSSQTLTICNGQSITVGSSTYSATGIYTDVLTSVGGCDSTVTTDLTVSAAITGSESVSICNGDVHTVGSSTYTATGVYVDVLTAMNGCDSTVTTNLTVNVVDVAVSVTGFTISANASGLIYQWIDCDNGNAAIVGENAQTFSPTADGNYAVVVTDGPCSDTSACQAILGMGINTNALSTISVYPNPTRDVVTLTMNANVATVDLMDAQGKVVETMLVENNGQIDFSNYERGVYYLRIRTENETTVKRVVKN